MEKTLYEGKDVYEPVYNALRANHSMADTISFSTLYSINSKNIFSSEPSLGSLAESLGALLFS